MDGGIRMGRRDGQMGRMLKPLVCMSQNSENLSP